MYFVIKLPNIRTTAVCYRQVRNHSNGQGVHNLEYKKARKRVKRSKSGTLRKAPLRLLWWKTRPCANKMAVEARKRHGCSRW